MPRDDDSFWLAVFRQAPVIAVFMAVFGIAGGVIGGYHYIQLLHFLRVYLCVVVCGTGAGIAVGLILGVMVDSLIRLIRGDGKKRRKKKRLPHDHIGDPD